MNNEHIDPGTHITFALVDAGDDGADAVSVVTNDDGDVIGFNVECLICQGVFNGVRTVALLMCALGSELPDFPQPGTMLVLALTEGRTDKGAVVLGRIPGGARPIPKSSAGVAVSDEGLKLNQVRQPPKGVGMRFYVRGAPFLIRLKGAQEGFAGALYIEADDKANDPEGKNGSFIRMTMDPTTKKFAIKAREAVGASMTLLDGIATLESPDHSHQVRVGNDGIFISGKNVSINGETFIRVDGLTMINMPPGAPPTPANAANYGPGGVGIPSTKTYIGS